MGSIISTTVICILLAAAVFFAARSIYRRRKSGGCGCGCKGCTKCRDFDAELRKAGMEDLH